MGRKKKEPRRYKDIVVKIYWQHDLDLISLFYYPGFSVSYWVKESLKAYVRGESISLPIPKEQKVVLMHKNKAAHIKLYEDEEQDLIDFVDSFRVGFRNNGIKQIVRSYFAEHMNVYFMSSQFRLMPPRKRSPEEVRKIAERRKPLDIYEHSFEREGE